ncbi:MAG: glycoside hydrolase family protein, partial [Desulfobulbaceae bacterium]
MNLSPTGSSPPDIGLILDNVYAWSQDQGFRGYNKHDGLNSLVLRLLLGWGKWPRIFAIQAVMRAPINLRPLLAVPKTYNPKGLALFTLGLLDRFRATGNELFKTEAEAMLARLATCRSQGQWSGHCWGYAYPWQDLGFFAPPRTPNAVVTSFVCEAFLEAYRTTGRKEYLDTVAGAIRFFLNDLTVIEDTEDTLCLAYMPLPMTMKVMDVSILVGAVLAQYGQLAATTEFSDTARRLVNFVVSKQTGYGAWYYTDPPGDSLIGHDNYHTGFILDALWRYMAATGDWQWKANYSQGLAFYAEKLFNHDGSPRWMSDKDYPHDIHGAAQGLITFTNAVKNQLDYKELMNNILLWSVTNMYDREGRFYYQKRKHYTKKFTLLRWCNAWMFRALAAWVRMN